MQLRNWEHRQHVAAIGNQFDFQKRKLNKKGNENRFDSLILQNWLAFKSNWFVIFKAHVFLNWIMSNNFIRFLFIRLYTLKLIIKEQNTYRVKSKLRKIALLNQTYISFCVNIHAAGFLLSQARVSRLVSLIFMEIRSNSPNWTYKGKSIKHKTTTNMKKKMRVSHRLKKRIHIQTYILSIVP